MVQPGPRAPCSLTFRILRRLTPSCQFPQNHGVPQRTHTMHSILLSSRPVPGHRRSATAHGLLAMAMAVVLLGAGPGCQKTEAPDEFLRLTNLGKSHLD